MHSKRVFRNSLATDYTPDMHKITVPTLLLWGKHDGATPVELAQNAYDVLGTPATDKRIVIFDHSAHNPMNEEPEKFYREVKAFVDQYSQIRQAPIPPGSPRTSDGNATRGRR